MNMKEKPMATSESYERLGAKLLSLPDVIAQSVGFLGPVFSSAFVIPLVVGVISASGKGGGVAAPLSVILAAIGVFGLGWVVSSYATESHAARSLYDHVTRGLGERVGTAAGWLYYGGVTILLTGLLLLIGGYLQGTIAAEFGVNALPSWAWTAILIAVIGAILYFGVRISTRSQLVLALVSIIVVGAFFIFVIIKLGSSSCSTCWRSRSLRGVGLPRDLRDGAGPPDLGSAGQGVPAARLADRRDPVRGRRVGGDAAHQPVLDRAVRPAADPALLRAVR